MLRRGLTTCQYPPQFRTDVRCSGAVLTASGGWNFRHCHPWTCLLEGVGPCTTTTPCSLCLQSAGGMGVSSLVLCCGVVNERATVWLTKCCLLSQITPHGRSQACPRPVICFTRLSTGIYRVLPGTWRKRAQGCQQALSAHPGSSLPLILTLHEQTS